MSKIEERANRKPKTLQKFDDLFAMPATDQDTGTTSAAEKNVIAVPVASKDTESAPVDDKSDRTVSMTNKNADSSRISKDPLVTIPQKNEKKSLARTVLFKPSVHKSATEKCKRLGISFNEAVNQLLERFVEKN